MYKILIKTFGSLGLLIAGSSFISAHNAVKITEPDNKETFILLNTNPKVYMENSSLVLVTENDKVVFEKMHGMCFELVNHDINGIEGIWADYVTFKVSSVCIEGFNLIPSHQVFINDITGKTMTTTNTDESGYVNISITDFPTGIYILNSKDKSFKFYKK